MIVSLEELKMHLRVLTDDEDTLLTSLLAQAQEAASDYCGVDWQNTGDVP